jgi:hypothetical protein
MPLIVSGTCCEIYSAVVVMSGEAQNGHAMTIVLTILKVVFGFAPNSRANQRGCGVTGIEVERK